MSQNPTRRLPILTIFVAASHIRRTAIAVPDPSIVPTAIVPIAVPNPSMVPTAIVTIAKTVNTVNVLPSALRAPLTPARLAVTWVAGASGERHWMGVVIAVATGCYGAARPWLFR